MSVIEACMTHFKAATEVWPLIIMLEQMPLTGAEVANSRLCEQLRLLSGEESNLADYAKNLLAKWALLDPDAPK